jgi:hypothetical protein
VSHPSITSVQKVATGFPTLCMMLARMAWRSTAWLSACRTRRSASGFSFAMLTRLAMTK